MRSSEGLYFSRLDHVRAVAAFLVFFWHYAHLWVPTSYSPPPEFFMMSVLEEGYTGVALFFTLSGYLFAKILDGRQVILTAFFWNRFIRLAPLLTAVMIYCAVFEGFTLSQFWGASLGVTLFGLWARGPLPSSYTST